MKIITIFRDGIRAEQAFRWVGVLRAAHIASMFVVSCSGPILNGMVHTADAGERIEDAQHQVARALPADDRHAPADDRHSEKPLTFDHVIDCFEAIFEAMTPDM